MRSFLKTLSFREFVRHSAWTTLKLWIFTVATSVLLHQTPLVPVMIGNALLWGSFYFALMGAMYILVLLFRRGIKLYPSVLRQFDHFHSVRL